MRRGRRQERAYRLALGSNDLLMTLMALANECDHDLSRPSRGAMAISGVLVLLY